MKRQIGVSVVAGFAVAVLCGRSAADPIPWEPWLPQPHGSLVLHEPIQSGGPAADTDFINMAGNPSWSLLADDFLVTQPGTVGRVVWWGFYNLDAPPPVNEIMRIRFYEPRPSDGLPGDILFEESFLNPSRIATGLEILVDFTPDEYIYQVDLATPFELDANVPFWLEITQIGSPETTFRWEFAFTDQNDFAFMSPSFPDWSFATSNLDLAFQLLSIPEPQTLILTLLGSILLIRRRRH